MLQQAPELFDVGTVAFPVADDSDARELLVRKTIQGRSGHQHEIDIGSVVRDGLQEVYALQLADETLDGRSTKVSGLSGQHAKHDSLVKTRFEEVPAI